ncbi:MAG: hypothetical protein HOA61_03550, partial [Bacteroidetes bacterium]|nr:hypothetical protein [Bacteroidota bacterium]
MKKSTIILSLLTLCFFTAYSQTNISGGSVSGTWTLSGSPYLIQGSIMIPDSQTLSIEPGVQIEFKGTYKLLVLGRLLAIGTEADTISWTASDTTNGWRGIRFDNTTNNNDTSVITYCKLTFGRATGTLDDRNGGAIYIKNFSKIIISYSQISNCFAEIDGGGIYSFCYYLGSGYGHPIILNNTIHNNIANNGSGGGVFHYGENPIIYNNTITHNIASTYGGGIYITQGGYLDVLISNNKILYNSSDNGGGICCHNTKCIMSNNLISNNNAQYGGGISYRYGQLFKIQNNIINNNKAKNGGGISLNTPNLGERTIINNTIANNYAENGGGIHFSNSEYIVIINTILYGNTANKLGYQVFIDDEISDPDFYNCDIQGGITAFELNFNIYQGNYKKNIDSNPHFVSPSIGSGNGFDGANSNWSLKYNSPCIDTGTNASVSMQTDFYGNTRIQDGNGDSIGIVDIGAIEFKYTLMQLSGRVYAGLNDYGAVFLYTVDSLNNLTFIDSTTFWPYNKFSFSNLKPENYIILAALDSNSDHFSEYISTYYGDKIHSYDAQIITASDTNYDIHMVEKKIINTSGQVKRTNNWYFGLNAGLEFNSNYPKVLTDGNIVTGGGSAIMSDTSGNLMFYSDGENVWNKNHDLMPNGQGLLGLNGSTQAALIIPIPENDTLLYLFTTDGINSALTYGLRYSIINMNLKNGLGNVTSTKNVKLLQPVSQKISAVYHSNGIDIWLLTHHWGSDTFYSYKITSSGISQPVLSGVGTYHTGSHANSTGHLKLSPDGKKIAVTSQNKGILEIFDFDNSTGVVSNQIQFNFPIVHGIEFSPSSSLLYVSTLSASEIFQINLNAGSDSAIKKSLLKIGEAKKEPPMGQDYGLGSLQLASDGKIYCATAQIGSYFLDVILQPDSLGENCRFKNQYVFLNGKTSFFGFPNFFRSYFNNMPTANFPKLSGEIKMSHSTTNHGKVYLYSAYKNYSFRLFDSTTFEMKNNGTFEFPFMNDAQYKMIAVLDSNSTDYNNYYSTWYGDELDSANASIFTAPGSYTINLISTPNISGTVYSANGSFGMVYLYKINSSNQYSLIDSTTFDSSGYYRFPYLNSGNYLLHAVLNQNSPNYSDYAPTYYVDVVH